MKRGPVSFSTLATLIAYLLIPPVWGGSIYKCTQPDGSVTFSNIACPQDTVERETKGRTGPAFQNTADEYNPYSLTEQARRIDERHFLEQMQKNTELPQNDYASNPLTSQSELSYEEALQRATEDAGYRDYGRLTAAQQMRVHKELINYRFRPREEDRIPEHREQQNMRSRNHRESNVFVSSGNGFVNNSGEVLTPSGEGYINNQSGTYYIPAPGGTKGLINNSTGDFMPIH